MIQDDLPDLNSSSLPWIEQDLVRGGDEITAVVEHSTRNLAEMVNDCRAAGVPIFLCTAPANLRYASLQVPLDGNSPFANLARKAAEHVKTGRFREALARLEPELSAYREDYQRGAVLFFLAGQAYDGVRDFENARACYLRASDLDPLNWRAQTRLNEAIRRLAAGMPGAALIDVEQAFRWAVPDGIPDHRLFFDNCHPRPEGHQLIAETLLEALDARLPASSIQR
jgi:tetratricopeptide (TPR) repeat protein